MKRFIAVLSGVFAGLCLFVTPTLASRTQLTVNIPDGHNAQVTNQSIKIDSKMTEVSLSQVRLKKMRLSLSKNIMVISIIIRLNLMIMGILPKR